MAASNYGGSYGSTKPGPPPEEKSGSHAPGTLSTDRTPATEGLGRKVMVPATATCMTWCRQNQEERAKSRWKSGPWACVDNVHTPFGGQTRDERTLSGSQKAAIRGRLSRRIPI